MFFIFGSPRSGTTLLAQCLSAHSEIIVPGEVSISAIVRAGQAVLPTEGWTFEKDDVLFVNVLRESAEKLERLLGLKE